MGTPSQPDARQAVADELAPVALELAERIRHDSPDVLDAEVLDRLTRFQLKALCLLLAAAGDTSVSPEIWWGWVRYRESIEQKAPIVWAEDEKPIEEMDSTSINDLIAELAGRNRSDDEIAEATGLTAGAVAGRRRRMKVAPGLRRGDVRTARAGVA